MAIRFLNGQNVTGSITVSGNISAGSGTFSAFVYAEDEIHLTDAGTTRAKLLLNSSDRDNVELRAESLGSTMKFFTVGTEALELDANQNSTFAGSVTTAGAVTIANTSVSQTSPTTQLLFDNNNIDNGGGYNIDFKSSSNDTANRFMARIQALRGSGAISSLGFFTETGSALTRALLLDSSQNATFTGNVLLGDDKNLDFGSATDFRIVHNSTTNVNHVSSKLDRQLSINANIINLTNQANTTTYLKLESSAATFANVPIVGTMAVGNNTTKAASTAFVTAAVAAGGGGAGVFLPLVAGSGSPLTGDLYLKTTNDASIAREQIIWQTSQGTNRSFIRVGGSYANNALEFGTGNSILGMILHANAGLSIGTTVATTLPPSSGLLVQGNVGIGTTSPNSKLDVRQAGDGIALELHNTGGNVDDFVDIKMIAGNTTAGTLGTILRHQRDGSGGGDFSILTNPTLTGTPTEKLIVKSGGNVGIGTDSPTAKLTISSDVGGDGTWVNSGILIENSASSAECAVVWKNAETGSNYWFTGLNQSNIYRIAYGTGFVNTNSFLQINNTGTLTLDGYDLANKTGTPTYMLGTDADGNVVKVLGGDIPGSGTVTGSGTAEYIPKWNSTSALVNSKAFQSTASSITTFNIGTPTLTCDFLNYQDTTGAIAGKVPIIEAKAAVIGIGARDKTYTTIYEGIKIIPATSHYLTRITPRLEVYPYEDPSTTTDNTYDTSFVGSCFSMGSQNTIGNSASSNLGVFGFNNTIAGDKFVIIGQGNVLGKANVSSLAVGTTNTNSGNGKLVNSLLVGQNMTLTQPATRSIVAGINHSFQGAMNNTVIVGSGNQGFGSNNFIWGSSNQGSGINNIMLGGFSCQITSASGNRYGSALMGWNNTLQASTRATFITGRDNIIVDTDYSIMGGFNNDTSANHSSLLVGTKNYGRGTGNITGGEQNTHESNTNNYNLMVGFKNKTYQTGTNSLIAGSTNEIGSANNLVVGQNNKVQSDTKNNIVGGNSNDILSQVATGQFNENNILSGLRNNIYIGSNNIVNGLQNDIGINANSSSKVSHSIVIGSNNNVGNQAAGTIANKSNMAVFGATNDVRGNNAFVAGSNNGCFTDNAIILGNNNSAGGVSAGEAKVIQIGFSIQPNSQSDYLAIGYGMSALPTTAVDNNNIANKYTAIGRNPDNNVDYDLSSLDPVSFIVGAGTQQNYRRTAIAVTCKNSSSEESNVILPGVGKYRNYTNDTTAAAGGVPIYGLYHTSGTIKIRLT